MSKIKQIIKRLEESRLPEVGIFFKIHGKIWGWGEPVRDLEPVRGIVDIDYLHSDYYDDLVYLPELKLPKDGDYFDYPRGRVLYYMDKDRFKVIIDRCLDNLDDKYSIAQEFNLPLSKVDWEFDEHYVCAKCSK